jgi:hypothetical protein
MNESNTTAVAVRPPQLEMFGTLFVDKATGRSIQGFSQREGKTGAIRFGLLPMRSKSGASLKSEFNLTGAALTAKRDNLAVDLKVRQGGMVGVAMTSPQYTGGYGIIHANGDVTVKFKHRAGAAAVDKKAIIASLTNAERAEIAEAYLENKTPAIEA